jgi:dTDP-4-amino-4,6-dideoxygalactose transaminase
MLFDTDGIGGGKYSKRVEKFLEDEFFPNSKVYLTTSGTTALEMAAILGDFDYGDEIIMPSYTFPSTANAFVREGCRPVYVDVRLDTFNLHEKLIEDAITPLTKAIVPVHYAGVGCNMDIICQIAKRHNLLVIEDAAQCFDSYYKDRSLGSIGDIGVLSFHGTKNIGCGEGGAIIINNDKVKERAEIILNKGTDRNKMLRGEVDKYSWVDVGSSFLISDYLAAILHYRLSNYYTYTSIRQTRYDKYYEFFIDNNLTEYVLLPTIPSYAYSNKHIFYVLVRNHRMRDLILEKLNLVGIKATTHYYPLHMSKYGKQFKTKYLPVTEHINSAMIRFPLDEDVTNEMLNKIKNILTEVC